MRNLLIFILNFSLLLIVSSCSPLEDDFQGTDVYYYLQNNSSANLYYELEDVAPSREANDVVDIGATKQIGWTEQFEVSGPPFSKIRVYNDENKAEILFETDSDKNFSNLWSTEKIGERKYNQTLIVSDDMINIQ